MMLGATGRLGLALLAICALAGSCASVASAVIVHLPTGKTLSYQPLRGAQARSRADALFSNLDYNGGPVMPSNSNYTIYWDPQGGPAYPSDYKSGVDQYLTDLAHDSGGHANVDSVAAQYNDASGNYANYDSTFAGRLNDTDPYPASGCTGATICLTDTQIQAELDSFLTSHNLPRDLTHEYFVLTPPGVETCFNASGSEGCSAGSTVNPKFCAYHGNRAGAGEFIYADDPYVTGKSGCDDGNHPTGSSSDGVLQGGLSHEHDESITDPEPNNAWTDIGGSGGEIGDKCSQQMGTSFGTAPNGDKYNQVINGHLYWYQHEWSNQTNQCLGRLTPTGTPPVATFTAAATGDLEMSFDAGASSATGGVVAYSWQFNDNSDPSNPPLPIETDSPTVNHTFPAAGTYNVALTVFASDGTSTGTAQTVTVTDLPVAASGWKVSGFASDFYSTRLGPMGIVSDASNNLYVGDAPNGLLYRFGPSGGIADANQLSSQPIGTWPLGLAFGKDGELYAVLDGDDEVVQIDPSNGAVLRHVATVGIPLGLATDPVSGDLLVTSDADGGVDRISDPSSVDPVVTPYATGMSSPDGISAGPDGTFYVEDSGNIDSVSATNSPSPGAVSELTYVSGADGVAVGANPFDPAAPSYVVANSNDGSLTQVNLGKGQVTTAPMFSGGTRGDFVTVAPDGCLYATQTHSVVRVSSATGACPFAPISPFQPPNAQPAAPGPLTPSTAELRAFVNPQGTATTFHFEYGNNATYGTSTPEASAGSASQPTAVSQTVSGLTPGATYHYRVVAHNQAGTINGSDNVLSTPLGLPAPPPGPYAPSQPPRLVSPPTVTGRAAPGRTLTCNPGTWTAATSFGFSWIRDAGAAVGAGATYAVRRADVNHRVACRVEAHGPGGSAPALSAARSVRLPAPGSFVIGLSAATVSTASVKAHGVNVTVTSPRPAKLTVRLLMLRKGRHTAAPRVLASRRVTFSRQGSRTVTLTPSPAALRRLKAGKAILRISASGVGGGQKSRPASVTVLR